MNSDMVSTLVITYDSHAVHVIGSKDIFHAASKKDYKFLLIEQSIQAKSSQLISSISGQFVTIESKYGMIGHN
jgi:hypothetical protein